MLTQEEKAKRFDELQSWFWWLKRRTRDGSTHTIHLKTFLKGITEYFEPYPEEDDNNVH